MQLDNVFLQLQAYYHRAQALEVLDRKQECVEYFIMSFTHNQMWTTFITAVKIAVEHGRHQTIILL